MPRWTASTASGTTCTPTRAAAAPASRAGCDTTSSTSSYAHPTRIAGGARGPGRFPPQERGSGGRSGSSSSTRCDSATGRRPRRPIDRRNPFSDRVQVSPHERPRHELNRPPPPVMVPGVTLTRCSRPCEKTGKPARDVHVDATGSPQRRLRRMARSAPLHDRTASSPDDSSTERLDEDDLRRLLGEPIEAVRDRLTP